MNNSAILYKRHQFPPEIIQYAVWLYHRFNLSHRDIEDLLAEKGIVVTHESIRLWRIKFGPAYAGKLRHQHHLQVLRKNSSINDISTSRSEKKKHLAGIALSA